MDDSLDTILEVHAIAPPNPRSWFIGEQVIEGMCAVRTQSSDAQPTMKMESCC